MGVADGRGGLVLFVGGVRLNWKCDQGLFPVSNYVHIRGETEAAYLFFSRSLLLLLYTIVWKIPS